MQNKCSKCHYTIEHPFGLTISNGICSGCITHTEKNALDWQERKDILAEILSSFRRKHQRYDCVVPVTGDAEDFYTLSLVVAFGLAPLVVCVNDYYKNDIGWQNLHQLITHFDVDSLVYNPDIRVYKDLVRTSLRKFNHILLPFLQLHTSFPVHIAYERKIPLIIWGQNQSVEQVGKFSHLDNAEMSRWSRCQHDLFEKEIDVLIGNGAQVDSRKLNYYRYPDVTSLSRRGVKGIYLSNYFRWDPLDQNSRMVEFGYKPQSNPSSYDIYERAGSSVYYHLHDLLKMKRVGYRKISDHVARDIRHGRLTSEEGCSLINTYAKSKVYIKPFFDWLNVTKSGYEWFLSHQLKGVLELVAEDRTELNDHVDGLPAALVEKLTSSFDSEKEYLLFGKGVYI